jgi:hypothetical protein
MSPHNESLNLTKTSPSVITILITKLIKLSFYTCHLTLIFYNALEKTVHPSNSRRSTLASVYARVKHIVSGLAALDA